MTHRGLPRGLPWIARWCDTGRKLLLFAWIAALVGPLGLVPTAGHSHSHPGSDIHCAACVLTHSGVTLTASVTPPTVNERVWEPVAPVPSPFYPDPIDFSFLRRAPPVAS